MSPPTGLSDLFQRNPRLPELGATVSEEAFLKATGLTSHQLERFAAEGDVVTRYTREHGHIVEGADRFVERVMGPAGRNWPPAAPELDVEGERLFAATGDREYARQILEPFRFRALAQHWDRVVELARPSARLVPTAAGQAGSSKLGGLPDVGQAFEWPRMPDELGKGEPLGFVAQIRLADIQAVCPSRLLPSTGLLLFFYDTQQSVWGFDPHDRGHWAVIYQDGPLHSLKEAPEDMPQEGSYKEVYLEARGELTLPELDSLEIQRLGLSDQGGYAYGRLLMELSQAHGEVINRCLGWPEGIQHDPASEVQLPFHGIYAGNPEGYATDEGKRLMAQRDVWRLVLQVDSEEDAGMMWGDVGRLYFMMREQDLLERAWDQAWFSLQCA